MIKKKIFNRLGHRFSGFHLAKGIKKLGWNVCEFQNINQKNIGT